MLLLKKGISRLSHEQKPTEGNITRSPLLSKFLKNKTEENQTAHKKLKKLLRTSSEVVKKSFFESFDTSNITEKKQLDKYFTIFFNQCKIKADWHLQKMI